MLLRTTLLGPLHCQHTRNTSSSGTAAECLQDIPYQTHELAVKLCIRNYEGGVLMHSGRYTSVINCLYECDGVGPIYGDLNMCNEYLLQ